MMKRNTCPCCGFEGLHAPAYKALPENVLVRGIAPPYSQYFGEPSFEVCDCCGFEFGNDDEPGTAQPQSFEEYLKEWIQDACIWFSADAKPASWSLHSQLADKQIWPAISRPAQKGVSA
jgi:hypothetical protein